ncbi:MAG: T9SS type A sorting domain-containing protein [Bacteroidales bacterium]
MNTPYTLSHSMYKFITIPTAVLRTLLFPFLLVSMFVLPAMVQAQPVAGPAGVGNSHGTNGQPRLALWLDASSLSLANNADVGNWIDISGNGNHATQASVNHMPVYVSNMINGKPGVRFRPSTPNRSETFLQYDGSHFVGNPYAIFSVAARRSTLNNYILGGSQGPPSAINNYNLHFGWRNNTTFTQAQYGNDIDGSLITTTLYQFSIISSSRNLTTTPFTRNIAMDGQVLNLSGSNINNLTPLASYPNPYIGRYRDSYSQLDMAEHIQYSSFVNRAQQIVIENYLSLKYNMSIGSSLFYAHETFTHDLIGIGSSDGSQKHSASSKSSGGLWLREYNNSFDEASEFVFLAHDNTAAGETVSGLPGHPSLQARSTRTWYVQRTPDTHTEVSMGFELASIGLTPGASNQVYYLLYRADSSSPFQMIAGAMGLVSEGIVWIHTSNTMLQSGYYTLARSADTGRTWYSYRNGDWDAWETWSLEQGGTDFVNDDRHTPTTSPTAMLDRVVINAGHRVQVSTHGKQNMHLEVENGILDLGTTQHHFFPTISGTSQGTIRLAADHFPGGNAEAFHAATGGTVEYNGTGYELATERHFNNVRINLMGAASRITLKANYFLKGNLVVERGNLQINDNSSTQILTLDVNKNLEVMHQGSISVGQGNTVGSFSIPSSMPSVGQYHSIFHQILVGGDLINQGSVRLTNQSAPHYGQFTQTGAATLIFKGFNHARAELEGTTDLYNLIVDKGVDQTFVLEVFSHDYNNFRLFGPNNVGRRETAPFTAADPEIRKALWIRRGTLKLDGSILIPSLTEGSQAGGNGDYAIPASGALWIAGPDVRVYTTAVETSPDLMPGTQGLNNGGSNQALSLLGTFRITHGFFSTRNSAGFIFWNSSSASVEIAGGIVDASQFRSTSTTSSDGKTTFLMSGGELLVRGDLNNFERNGTTYVTAGGETSGSYPIFGMVDSLGVFNMSGGIIAIYKTSGNNSFGSNALYINTRPVNHNVSGGTIELIGYGENRDFDILSTGNLFNLSIRQTGTSHTTRAYMGSHLHLEGTLTIFSRTELFSRRQHGNFRDRSYDLTVSQGFVVQENAQYHAFQNTTTLLTRGSSTAYFFQPNPQFYNLVIRRHPSLPSTRRNLNNNAIVVLNDLTLEEGAVLRHGNQDITVRGNIFNSGTIEHEGAANTGQVRVTQRGTVRQINLNNAGSHTSIPNITLAAPPAGGTQATAVAVFNGIPAAGNALPLAGILITNPGSGYTTPPSVTISSGGGSATAVLSTSHEIGGNGQGTFANLLIDEPHPTPVSTKVTLLSANQRITKTMTLANGILDLETYNLDVEGTLSTHGQANEETLYSETRMFRMAGNHGDGGLTRRITGNGTYLFPIGTFKASANANRYAWAKPTFSNVTSPGKVQINAVPRKLATMGEANPQRYLTYYWRIRHADFSAIPNVHNYFRSYESDFFNVNNWGQIVVGKVIGNSRSPQHPSTIGTLINQNPFRLLNYNVTILEQGEFTAAFQTMFNGTITTYYSRVNNGNWSGNAWTNRNNWSLVDHSQPYANRPAAPDFPKPGDIAVIGFGGHSNNGGYNVIEIGSGAVVECAELRFVSNTEPGSFSSRLVIDENASFTAGIVTGNGTIYAELASGNYPTISADFSEFANVETSWFIFKMETNNRTYEIPRYADVFPNLRFEGGNANIQNKTAFFSEELRVRRNLRVDQGARFEIRTPTFVGGTLFLGDGGSSGRLQFSETQAQLLETGSISMTNRSGNVIEVTGSQNLEHRIIVNGSITQNDGRIDLFTNNTNGNNAILELKSAEQASLDILGGTRPEFYRIVLNKGTNATPRFSFNAPFELLGPTHGATKALELQNGTLVLNHNDIDITLSSGGADFLIPSTTALLIHGGKARVTAPGSNGILLDGLLEIRNTQSELILDGGDGSDNYIEYSSSGNAVIRVVGGKLEVGSQIRGSLVNDAGILRFHQLAGGGTSRVVVGTRSAPNGSRGVFEIHNTGSHFQMYNGTFTIARGHDNPATASRAALFLHPDRQGLNEWGRFVLGDGTTTTLGVNAGIELPTVEVLANTTAQTQLNPLAVFGDLTIQSNGALDGNQLNLTVRKNFINHGQASINTDTLFMLSKDASNYLRGSFVTGNLVLEPTTNVYLFTGTDLMVNGNLHLASGTFEDRGRQVQVRGHVRNDGSHISEGSGRLLLNGSNLQRISGYGQFGQLELNNIAGAELQNDLNLDNNFTLTQGIFNLRNHALNLGQLAQIVGSGFSASKMIATSGSFADKGIRRYVGTGASELLFPIGVVAGGGNKYTPVTLKVSQNLHQGHLRIYPVNQPHMTATGPDVLQYYWTLESQGLTGVDAELKFKYLNSDVRGNEAAYYAGRLVDDGWAKFPPEFVNQTTDSITFLFASAANLSGDYTAGIDPHLPTQIPVFVSTGSGNWSDMGRWMRLDGGEIPEGGPNGHIVQVREGDVILLDRFRILSYRTTLNGRIDVGTEVGHNLGRIDGGGTLAVIEGKLPVGNYSQFLAAGTGSTIEYGGPDSYNIPDLTTYGLSSNTYNNLVIAGEGGIKTLPAGTITIRGNLLIQQTATLESRSSQRIILHGNMSKAVGAKSRFDFSSQWIEMSGSVPQEINGTYVGSGDRLWNLEINNPSGVSINGEVDLGSGLRLTNGVLTTLTNPITVNWRDNGAVVVTNSGSFINGILRRNINNSVTNPFFPVGKGNRRRDVLLVSPTAGMWTVEYFNTDPATAGMYTDEPQAPLARVSEAEYWRISRPNSGSARIRLHFGLGSMVSVEPSDLANTVIAEWDAINNRWFNRGGSGIATGGDNGYVTAANSSSFSTKYFTIGSTSDLNPLPIELLSFTGKAHEDAILLEWVTASEINNHFFTLERSFNGRDFHIVAVVASQAEYGFSNQNLYYSNLDLQPREGMNYYRLKQTDFDGSYEYSKVIGVLYQQQQQVSFSLFPNPNRGNSFSIALNQLRPFENLEMQITDLNGRRYYNNRYSADDQGQLRAYIVPPGKLPAGIYVVSFSGDSGRFVVRMVVN